ncbi:hypothetical protein HDU87_006779 [Geranomyces variabilis]|uniref:BZIP domain-containing protein n=1 Tax=Geranomyces variabilis TaxID=109894 RepID=A0AAD5TPS4_9FUNG|nr:hypothetical protein HDU87_006779 [Geranomyces variabilis]
MRRSTFSGISRPMSRRSEEPLSPAEVESLAYHHRSLSHPPPQPLASEYYNMDAAQRSSSSGLMWGLDAAPAATGVTLDRLTHVTDIPPDALVPPAAGHGHAGAAAHDEGQVGPRMRGVCGALPSSSVDAPSSSAGLVTTLPHTSTYNNTAFLSPTSSSHAAGMYGGYPASASSLSDEEYNRHASLAFANLALPETQGVPMQPNQNQFQPVSHHHHHFDLPVQQHPSGQHPQLHHHHQQHQHPLPHTSFHALDPNPSPDYYTEQSFSGSRSRNLETRGRSLSDAGAPGDGDPVQLKRLRNTEAARRSRLRRIAHIDQLEARIAELEAENHRLILRVANLESDRAARQSQSQHRPGEQQPWGGGAAAAAAQHQMAQVGNSPISAMAPMSAFGSLENIKPSDSPHS